MENADHRIAVLAEFNKALDRDRTLDGQRVHAAGTVEMTRKRTREPGARAVRAVHYVRWTR
jgi:ribonuclease G